MDIDIGFWLTILVAITGAIWLLDKKFRWTDQVKQDAARAEAEQVADGAGQQAVAAAKKPDRFAEAVEFSNSLLPVFLIVLVVRSFLFEPFTIPSGSMIPTLQIHDFVLVNKFSYGIRLPVLNTEIIKTGEPRHGDVMVFRYPVDPSKNFIKRVVGLPGDQIEIRGKQLIVNGKVIQDKLVSNKVNIEQCDRMLMPVKTWTFIENLDGKKHLMERRACIYGDQEPQISVDDRSWTVPPGHYFVMGDNRDNSLDSRFWGFVPEANIVGKASVIWMHWEALFSLPSFSRNGFIDQVEEKE